MNHSLPSRKRPRAATQQEDMPAVPTGDAVRHLLESRVSVLEKQLKNIAESVAISSSSLPIVFTAGGLVASGGAHDEAQARSLGLSQAIHARRQRRRVMQFLQLSGSASDAGRDPRDVLGIPFKSLGGKRPQINPDQSLLSPLTSFAVGIPGSVVSRLQQGPITHEALIEETCASLSRNSQYSHSHGRHSAVRRDVARCISSLIAAQVIVLKEAEQGGVGAVLELDGSALASTLQLLGRPLASSSSFPAHPRPRLPEHPAPSIDARRTGMSRGRRKSEEGEAAPQEIGTGFGSLPGSSDTYIDPLQALITPRQPFPSLEWLSTSLGISVVGVNKRSKGEGGEGADRANISRMMADMATSSGVAPANALLSLLPAHIRSSTYTESVTDGGALVTPATAAYMDNVASKTALAAGVASAGVAAEGATTAEMKTAPLLDTPEPALTFVASTEHDQMPSLGADEPARALATSASAGVFDAVQHALRGVEEPLVQVCFDGRYFSLPVGRSAGSTFANHTVHVLAVPPSTLHHADGVVRTEGEESVRLRRAGDAGPLDDVSARFFHPSTFSPVGNGSILTGAYVVRESLYTSPTAPIHVSPALNTQPVSWEQDMLPLFHTLSDKDKLRPESPRAGTGAGSRMAATLVPAASALLRTRLDSSVSMAISAEDIASEGEGEGGDSDTGEGEEDGGASAGEGGDHVFAHGGAGSKSGGASVAARITLQQYDPAMPQIGLASSSCGTFTGTVSATPGLSAPPSASPSPASPATSSLRPSGFSYAMSVWIPRFVDLGSDYMDGTARHELVDEVLTMEAGLHRAVRPFAHWDASGNLVRPQSSWDRWTPPAQPSPLSAAQAAAVQMCGASAAPSASSSSASEQADDAPLPLVIPTYDKEEDVIDDSTWMDLLARNAKIIRSRLESVATTAREADALRKLKEKEAAWLARLARPVAPKSKAGQKASKQRRAAAARASVSAAGEGEQDKEGSPGEDGGSEAEPESAPTASPTAPPAPAPARAPGRPREQGAVPADSVRVAGRGRRARSKGGAVEEDGDEGAAHGPKRSRVEPPALASAAHACSVTPEQVAAPNGVGVDTPVHVPVPPLVLPLVCEMHADVGEAAAEGDKQEEEGHGDGGRGTDEEPHTRKQDMPVAGAGDVGMDECGQGGAGTPATALALSAPPVASPAVSALQMLSTGLRAVSPAQPPGSPAPGPSPMGPSLTRLQVPR